MLLSHADKDVLRKSNIIFKHISRHLNVGADDLAKQGKNKKA